MRRRGKGKGGKAFGALARHFPKGTQWKLDYDYLAKLSPEERQWLANFNDAYYGGDFREAPGSQDAWPHDERLDIWSNKNTERIEAFAQAAAANIAPSEIIDDLTPGGEFDPDATPTYLDDEQYKQARTHFRSFLAKGRRHRIPKVTPAFERAKRDLRALVEEYTGEPDDEQNNDPQA